MLVACFFTGFTSVASFTACYVWCGFQTGNLAQLGLAVARTFETDADHTFLVGDRQALASLGSFLVGTLLGRVGDAIGPARRAWLVAATAIQAAFLALAAVSLHIGQESDYAGYRGAPSWITPAGFFGLAFASASLGLQGVIGKRLNTQFGTTLVLTTIWVELLNDPFLFARRPVKSRDHKFLAVLFLFLGAFIGRAMIDSSLGTVGTFAVGAAVRLLTSFIWVFVGGKSSI
ncbi:hypothetical protein HK100_002637 [Physocladia obscura]|uniref:Uncharacterized protein n=1 Tax=Physocladia obscura TaxID=109957 RepID=A0AAD5SWT5_9FUNG|nr:hypothetical protein HK100_002637 [Physocladia obscura]